MKVLGLGLALSIGGAAIANDYHSQGVGFKMEHGKHMMKRMFSRLDLTEQQQQAVRAIREQAHTTMDELKNQSTMSRSELKSQLKSIVQADSFDEQAFRELMAVKQSHRSEMAVIRAKMKHDIWHVLDEQQQDKMAQMVEKRAERRAERGFRHHGE